MRQRAFPNAWRAAMLAVPLLAGCQTVPPGNAVAVLPGTATRVNSVYWLDRTTCTSQLRAVTSVTITSGNSEGLEMTLQAADGIVPHQCPATTMPGAHILIRPTRPFATTETRDLTYVVVYDTTIGHRTSTFTRRFTVLPEAAMGAPRPAG